jgi:hypothetical protein
MHSVLALSIGDGFIWISSLIELVNIRRRLSTFSTGDPRSSGGSFDRASMTLIVARNSLSGSGAPLDECERKDSAISIVLRELSADRSPATVRTTLRENWDSISANCQREKERFVPT